MLMTDGGNWGLSPVGRASDSKPQGLEFKSGLGVFWLSGSIPSLFLVMG
jgi:hypothetical protein